MIGTQSTSVINATINDPKYFWNIGLKWLTDNQVEIAIATTIAIVLSIALVTIKRFAQRRAETRENHNGLLSITGRTIAKTSRLFIIIASIRLVAGYANPPTTVLTTVGFLFTVIAAFQVAIWLREIILGLVERRAGLNDYGSETLANAISVIKLLVTVALFSIAAIVVLDNLGVDVTGLVAGLGIGGIAIGLAAQGIFSDLFAALAIIFDKPFRRGDSVQYGDTIAKVEKIGLKTTRMRSVTGEQKIISNTKLLDQEITNTTRIERRRIRFGIGVIYQTKADQAAALPDLLKAVVEEHDFKFIRCGFTGFGDSSLDYLLEFDIYSTNYEDIFNGRNAVGMAILQMFAKEGLEFAYPTQTTFTAGPDGTMVMPFRER